MDRDSVAIFPWRIGERIASRSAPKPPGPEPRVPAVVVSSRRRNVAPDNGGTQMSLKSMAKKALKTASSKGHTGPTHRPHTTGKSSPKASAAETAVKEVSKAIRKR
jgi:hypothetical protein